MGTLLLEWQESYGDAPPAWMDRLIVADPELRAEVLTLYLAGADRAGAADYRDRDEELVDAVAGLPHDSQLMIAIDAAGTRAITDAERVVASDSPTDTLVREGIYRLVRGVGVAVEQFPMTIEMIKLGVVGGSQLLLDSSPGRDCAAASLEALARSQTDDALLPVWWRLCDLDSRAPAHAALGLLGLRWSPSGADAPVRTVTNALAQLARACTRAGAEELMSESAARRIFINLVRTTRRSRSDLNWDEIGRGIASQVGPNDGQALVLRAFGLERAPSHSAAPTERYEDPGRAKFLAEALSVDFDAAIGDAHEFLDGQRTHAARRGDYLPLVQSLCYFASKATPTDPKTAITWAREASTWQPHNHYTAVTLAEALKADGELPAATEVILTRLTGISGNPAVWVELGTLLSEHGEQIAAREALRVSTERFPAESPGWSALGELEVRNHRYDEAVTAFESGLRWNPRNRYLLPGLVRALALAGQTHAAREALARAESVLGAHSPIVTQRRIALESGEIEVVDLPATPTAWRSSLSADATGALARLYRWASDRLDNDSSERNAAETERTTLLTAAGHRHGVGLAVAAEFAFGSATQRSSASPTIAELMRVRRERKQLAGTPYSPGAFDSIVFDAFGVGIGDARLAPLQELSRLRATATLMDGAVLENRGELAMKSLEVLASASKTSFGDAYSVGGRRSAWAGNVIGLLAGTRDLWRARVEACGPALDRVEEDMALNLTM